jgi:hypothetical protein
MWILQLASLLGQSGIISRSEFNGPIDFRSNQPVANSNYELLGKLRTYGMRYLRPKA